MHNFDLRVCAAAEWTVARESLAHLGETPDLFEASGPNIGHFWIKPTVLDYYMTKRCVYGMF